MVYDVIILGSGAAGLAAALYTARARMSTLVLAGPTLGGWIALTDVVENYPGFPEPVKGPELAQRMQQQAERFGAKIELDEATVVDLNQEPFRITAYGGEYQAKTIIVATGASPRKLGVPGEDKFTGRGVSYCATCDGFFYRGKEVAVVGGGNSAVEEGIFLTRFADKLYLVHRRDRLRADAIVQERAFENDKIEFVWNNTVTEILGEQTVTGVRLRNVQTEEESILPVSGVFIYIGMIPNSDLFKEQLDMDQWGYILTHDGQHTNIPGVFACGDIQEHYLLQITTAVGSAARAAMQAEKYIAEQEHRAHPDRLSR
jgi:thioredoxin reductase (NADPH)